MPDAVREPAITQLFDPMPAPVPRAAACPEVEIADEPRRDPCKGGELISAVDARAGASRSRGLRAALRPRMLLDKRRPAARRRTL